MAEPTVKPWMGSGLTPTTLRHAEALISTLEEQRQIGYGIAYILMWNEQCLGMGLLNYIHPVHLNANLGLWLVPAARGRGLAVKLCERLIEIARQPLGLNRIEYFTLPENQASIKLAHAIGAKKEALCKRRVLNQDALLFSLLLNP